MTVAVKVDTDGLDEVSKNLDRLQALSLTIGFQGTDGARQHPEAKVSLATVAMFNEFGTINSPNRSFLRSTMREEGDRIARIYAEEMRAVFMQGKDPVAVLSTIGARVVGLVRDKIESSRVWATPNAPSTIRKKGVGKPPLIDTRYMLDHVSWAVRERGLIIKQGK